jgi:hypothetical protein
MSVVALAVPVLSLLEQHSADQASLTASNQTYARLVTAWIVPPEGRHAAQIVVQNPGGALIKRVTVRYEASWWKPGAPSQETGQGQLNTGSLSSRPDDDELGDIGSCSVAADDIAGSAGRTTDNGYSWTADVESVTFTDINGTTWTRSDTGTLTSAAPDPPPPGGGPFFPVTPDSDPGQVTGQVSAHDCQ